MKLGIALLRTIVGALFMGHGLQKLAGWFGGHGLDATGQAFEGMGLRPGRRHATAAGASETLGGALLAAGLMTPVGAAMITGAMATAIRQVHASNGPWVTEGGYEYNLVLIAAVFALTDVGPGALSLDAARGRDTWGPGWALAQLAAGVAGSAAVLSTAQAPAPAPPQSPSPVGSGEADAAAA